jgi:hypothetical protein
MWEYEHLLEQKKLIWTICVEMALWQMKGSNFPKTLSLLNSKGKEKWKNKCHYFLFYFFSIPSIVWTHVWVWTSIETKKLIWTFCVEMDSIYIFNFFKKYFCQFIVFNMSLNIYWEKIKLNGTLCVRMAPWKVEGVH